MDKWIIFCKHAVETLEYFSKQLAQTFESHGYETFWLDFDRLGLSAWKLRQTVQGKDAVLLTFNFIGLSGEEELQETDWDAAEPVSIWDHAGIRCLNILVDHPIYYYEQLQHPPRDMLTFCIDRDHVAYMKRFYPKLPCEFLPLAGNKLPAQLFFAEHKGQDAAMPESYEQWRMRPYPIVFTANYVPLANIEKQLDRLEPEYRSFYYELIDALIQQPEKDLLTLIEPFMKREIPDITDKELCMAMRTMCAVDLWIRTYFREKTVRILAEGGLAVHIFGKDWEQMDCARPENLISNNYMADSTECVLAIAQGKIALNTMPWFKDGAHDRIFTAMLQGAVALTDDSRYLRKQFTDHETLVYYDLNRLEALPEQVYKFLQEPEQMYEIACRAYETAVQQHTWKQRAEALLQFL